MKSIILMIMLLCMPSSLFAQPAEISLDSPDMVCPESCSKCMSCWRGKKQALEEFRCDCERFNDSCEHDRQLQETMRRELEEDYKKQIINIDEYRESFKKYRAAINAYRNKINVYKEAIADYKRKQAICESNIVDCRSKVQCF